MADTCDNADSGIADEEECLARHRREKKELQAEIQKLKHNIPKGDKKKKKEVTARIAVLEAELDAKHEQEIQELKTRLMTVHITDKKDDDCVPSEIQANGSQLNSIEVGIADKKPSKTQRRKEKKAQQQIEREERIRDQEIVNETGNRKVEAEKLKTALKLRGLAVHEVPSDGNCLYAAIADQLHRRQILSSVNSLRCQTAEYLRNHPDDFLPFMVKDGSGEAYSLEDYMSYCQKVESTSEWGGHTEIRALSDVLGTTIEVVQADGPNIVIGENFPGSPLILSYHRHAYGLGEHYNSVVLSTNTTEDEEGFS